MDYRSYMEDVHKSKKVLFESLRELDSLKTGKLKMGELEAMKMIFSALDHATNVCDALEDETGSSMTGSSMAGDYSGRRHYVRGHYSRSGGEYSRADAKREMMSHLANAYASAPDDEHRRMARDLMDRVERA